MRKIIRIFSYYFYRQFKVFGTVKKCLEKGLEFQCNIHGDVIKYLNCRSIWLDEFGFRYRCSELYVK